MGGPEEAEEKEKAAKEASGEVEADTSVAAEKGDEPIKYLDDPDPDVADPENPEFLMPPPKKKGEAAMPPPPPPPRTSAPAVPTPEATSTQTGCTIPPNELKYTEPEWSGRTCAEECYLEVLREGAIVETIDLTTKPYYMVGRDKRCDMYLQHPSISRQHAVVQLSEKGTVYVMDLGSTHGSFWNKDHKLKPNTYVPLKQGDMVKFGNSTRCYILCGGVESKEEVDKKRQEAFEKSVGKHRQGKAKRDDSVKEVLKANLAKRVDAEKELMAGLRPEFATWGDQVEASEDDPEAEVRALDWDMMERFDDEDEYYDRTKSGAAKRQKKAGGGPSTASVVSEGSVRRKMEKIEGSIAELTKARETAAAALQEATDKMECDDPVDAYVAKEQAGEHKKKMKQIDQELKKLQGELKEQQGLYERVKPALEGLRKVKKAKVEEKKPPPPPVAEEKPKAVEQPKKAKAAGGLMAAFGKLSQKEEERAKLPEEPVETDVVQHISGSSEVDIRKAIARAKREEKAKDKEAKVDKKMQILGEIKRAKEEKQKKAEDEAKPAEKKSPVAAPAAAPEAAAETGPKKSKRERENDRVAELQRKKERLDALRKKQEQQQPAE